MIEICCPWCGLRNASEFHHLGESRRRPDVAVTTRAEWRDYLYLRNNSADWVTETWFHRAGCRGFLTVERHTVTNDVRVCRPAAS